MREAINKKGEDLKRYTKEEKAEILKEVESLGNVSLVAKKHVMPSTTIQNWIRKKINSSNPSEIQNFSAYQLNQSQCGNNRGKFFFQLFYGEFFSKTVFTDINFNLRVL